MKPNLALARVSRKPARQIPFSFVLDNLYPLEPVIKPMFGCSALYLGGKIVFILRKKEEHPEVNGVWFATSRDHHESLKRDFPTLQSVTILGSGTTNWQMVHEDDPDFESIVVRACEMVLKGDGRIGHVPKRKNRVKKQHPGVRGRSRR